MKVLGCLYILSSVDKGSFLITSRIAILGKPKSRHFIKSSSLQVDPLPAFIKTESFESFEKKSKSNIFLVEEFSGSREIIKSYSWSFFFDSWKLNSFSTKLRFLNFFETP